MSYNYSSQEKRLLTLCGVDDDRIFGLVSPANLYRSVAINCFARNSTGPAVECLRVLMLKYERGPFRGDEADQFISKCLDEAGL